MAPAQQAKKIEMKTILRFLAPALVIASLFGLVLVTMADEAFARPKEGGCVDEYIFGIPHWVKHDGKWYCVRSWAHYCGQHLVENGTATSGSDTTQALDCGKKPT